MSEQKKRLEQESVKSFVRIRPMNSFEADATVALAKLDDTTVQIKDSNDTMNYCRHLHKN